MVGPVTVSCTLVQREDQEIDVCYHIQELKEDRVIVVLHKVMAVHTRRMGVADHHDTRVADLAARVQEGLLPYLPLLQLLQRPSVHLLCHHMQYHHVLRMANLAHNFLLMDSHLFRGKFPQNPSCQIPVVVHPVRLRTVGLGVRQVRQIVAKHFQTDSSARCVGILPCLAACRRLLFLHIYPYHPPTYQSGPTSCCKVFPIDLGH